VGASAYARLVQREPSGRFLSAGQRVEDAELSRQAGEAMILKSTFPGFGMRIFHPMVQCFWQFKGNRPVTNTYQAVTVTLLDFSKNKDW